MSKPNSWLPVQVYNDTGLDITKVTLKHRYDTDHHDQETWPNIKNQATVDGLNNIGFWTGFGRTGYDYWQIFFHIGDATFTCKDNFYCFLTQEDAKSKGVVKIRLTLHKMYVEPPKSSGADVSLSMTGIFMMANKDYGFYNIAHMVNTPQAIIWGISHGANGLEADLNFDDDGNPNVYKHGGCVSDCACHVPGDMSHVCSLVSKENSTPAKSLLNCIAAQPSVALHVVDTKMNPHINQERAGVNVIKLLEEELFSAGYKGNVIVSVAETKYIKYIKAAAEQAAISPYKARISFTFDQGGNNYQKVFDALSNINSVYRAYGTGISACVPGDYYDAIIQGCVAEHQGFHGLTYIWTLDCKDSMSKYLQHGVRGIMTNRPSALRDVLETSNIPLAKPETPIPPAKK